MNEKTPTRTEIFDANKQARDGSQTPNKFDWGFVEFRIPEQDFPALCMLFPGLVAKDAEERKQAWKEFRWSIYAEPYFVARTPQQVRRDTKRGVIVK